MAVSVIDADIYISENVIDIEDWEQADDLKKTRYLNVALSTLQRQFADKVIPDNAVYEFAAVLSVVYNDTYKGMQYGVKSFSVAGITYGFDGSPKSLTDMIPPQAKALISEANGGDTGSAGSRIQWTVM
ncbi:hypothetical protein AB1282_00285 [Gottfriedia sp. S16(2024)]|uniref:hypothetical protein n=1 Tax=Gottfriedia sp. S16(2024) TaxID=3162883 RepID=UPI003D211B86